jgi:predicted nucleic acid-binding protein
MALRMNVNEIQNLKDRKVFLDTNIWIYLFCPLSHSREFVVKKYSRAFNHLIRSNSKLYTDVTVLSEFINRYLRLAFYVYIENNEKGKDFDFKRDYKQTEDFNDNIKLIVTTIKNKILSRVSIANVNYKNKNIKALIDSLKKRMIDFNDLHIEKLCKLKGFILLTDDGDYADSSLDIISGNPKLLLPPSNEVKKSD